MTALKKKPRPNVKYLSLADQLRAQVLEGTLAPGQKLPTFAELKSEFGLGQTTLEKTYSILERERLIVRLPGRGTFVAEPTARALKNVIAIIGANASDELDRRHPYYTHLFVGIQQAARKAGQQLMLLDWENAIDWDAFDGVIVLAQNDENRLPISHGIPHILLLREIAGVPSILIDDYTGSRSATEYLLSIGHRRIAFLTQGRFNDTISNARLRGFQHAMRAAGIEPPSAWVRNLKEPWVPYAPWQEMGYSQMRRWLEGNWGDLGCTALLAQNDETAIGVLRALREAGLDIPRDVSVVGFDGTDIADYAYPRLTTVKVPLEEIGALGVELLLGKINGIAAAESARSAPPHFPIVLQATLRIGESTAARAIE